MSVKSAKDMNVGVKPMQQKGIMAQAISEPPIIKNIINKVDSKVLPKVEIPLVKEEFTPVDENKNKLNSDWIRVDLISNFVPYEWSDILIRPFKPRDQAKLAMAVKYNNFSMLFDVISATSTHDARELVFPDWVSLCILHKRFSYNDTPYNITWNSRYGVTVSNTTKIIKMEETRLSVDRKEYLEWKNKYSLVMPTCRDIEVITSDMDEETLYLFEKAQYIDPEPLKDRIEELRKEGDRIPSITARIEALDKHGVSIFNTIEEYHEKFANFGIKERAVVEIKPSDFDPEVAINALRNFKSNLEDASAIHKEVQDAIDESNIIENIYEKAKINTPEGQPTIINYKPRKEEVPLAFSPWTMFPYT
jgi:hypothetical protein